MFSISDLKQFPVFSSIYLPISPTIKNNCSPTDYEGVELNIELIVQQMMAEQTIEMVV